MNGLRVTALAVSLTALVLSLYSMWLVYRTHRRSRGAAEATEGDAERSDRENLTLDIFMSGFASGVTHGLTKAGAPVGLAIATAQVCSRQLLNDPIERTRAIEAGEASARAGFHLRNTDHTTN